MRWPTFGLILGTVGACGGSDISVKESGEAVCNGILDEDEEIVDGPFDGDQDGFFDGTNPGCVSTYAAEDLDCDDGDSEVGGPEEWYPDEDGDGHGIDGETSLSCVLELGYSAIADDCDDTLASIHPGADEYCDDIDNDCDDVVDEDVVDGLTFYRDADIDGYGDTSNQREACSKPTGYTEAPGDCDDTNPEINPDAEEICFDAVDNNCNDSVDEGCVTSFSGSWTSDLYIEYSCMGDSVSIGFDTLSVTEASPDITFTSIGSSQPGSMTGSISSAEWSVLATSYFEGDCDQSYNLNGTFLDVSTFEGTFLASFSGSACGDCSPSAWPIVLTR